MSQKLEQILELLLSEDNDQAEELLHEYVVNKARSEYESILDESDDEEEIVDEEIDEEIDEDAEEVDEDIHVHVDNGGVEEDIHRDNDFEADVTDGLGDDEDEISTDEFDDVGGDDMDGMDDMDDMDDMAGELGGGDDDVNADLAAKAAELTDELASLTADFEALLSDEMVEPEDAEVGDEYGDEFDDEGDVDDEESYESFDYDLDGEVVEEATKLQDTVSEQPMKGGGLKGSEHDSSNAKSPYTDAPKPTTIGKDNVKPVRANNGSEGKKGEGDKNQTLVSNPSNIKVDHKADKLDHGRGTKMPNTGDDRSNVRSPIPKK